MRNHDFIPFSSKETSATVLFGDASKDIWEYKKILDSNANAAEYM